jgi:hypothetical protein
MDEYGPKPVQLTAYVGMPSSNQSYLVCTKNCPITPQPIGGATMGMLMLLSTLQYQAPYMNSQYSTAAAQAGKAAFIQSGGQAFQDRLQTVAAKKAETVAKDAYHSVGITDTEVGVVLGTAKVIRDKQLDVNGPRIYFIKTHVTVAPDHGSVGLGINF